MHQSLDSLLRQVVPPKFFGDLDLQPDLGPLLVLTQLVPFHGRAEATLVTEAKLLQAPLAILTGLFEPLDHGGLVVESALLARHDAQNHDLVLRQMAQGAEVAGARVVVFEEVDVDVQVLEEHLGDGLVAALREPLAAVVPAAQVDAHRHVLGPLLDRPVDQVRVLAGELDGVAAVAFLRGGPHVRVTEIRQVRVVELHEPTARVVQVLQFLLVRLGEVVEEFVQRRVRFNVDALAAAPEVDHGRARDRHLGADLAVLGLAAGLGDLALEISEVGDLDRLAMAQLAGNDQLRRHPPALGLVGRVQAPLHLDPIQMLQEVEVEKRAPELAIRDGPEARLELLAHYIRNILVLQLLQIRGRGLSCCELFAGRQNLLGPQE